VRPASLTILQVMPVSRAFPAKTSILISEILIYLCREGLARKDYNFNYFFTSIAYDIKIAYLLFCQIFIKIGLEKSSSGR